MSLLNCKRNNARKYEKVDENPCCCTCSKKKKGSLEFFCEICTEQKIIEPFSNIVCERDAEYNFPGYIASRISCGIHNVIVPCACAEKEDPVSFFTVSIHSPEIM